MLTPAAMKAMDVGHLLAAARCELDELTATPLELELLERLEETDYYTARDAVCDEYGISDDELTALLEAHPASYATVTKMLVALNDAGIPDIDELTNALALLDVLGDEDIDTPETLRSHLADLKTFHNIVADAGDALTRLAAMATTQE